MVPKCFSFTSCDIYRIEGGNRMKSKKRKKKKFFMRRILILFLLCWLTVNIVTSYVDALTYKWELEAMERDLEMKRLELQYDYESVLCAYEHTKTKSFIIHNARMECSMIFPWEILVVTADERENIDQIHLHIQ